MKKHGIIKTIQLILFIGLTAACLYYIFSTPEVYHLIGTDASFRLLGILLWIVLGLSFIFILLDYNFLSSYKRDYRELDFAVHSDPATGIANRYSCDALIERYLDKPLPKDMCCIMLEITSIHEINRLHGHLKGNNAIRDFANILKMAERDLCFVGRNGGNKFLAVFETCSDEDIELFLSRIEQKVQSHNALPDSFPITYEYGTAFHEGSDIKTITQLIALANKRISSAKEENEFSNM